MNLKSKISDNSPQILLAAGIVGFIGAAVTAVMRSDKVKPIIKKTKKEIKSVTIEDVRYAFNSEKELKFYKAKLVTKAAFDISKEMALPIGIATVSIGCLLKSYNIMNNRQLALIGTINVLKRTANVYRETVLDEAGKETAKKIEDKVLEKEISNQLKTFKKRGEITNDVESFNRYFSKETSNKFPKEGADTVLPFLKGIETYFNQLLHQREHCNCPGVVRYNEVLDALGFPKIPEGETSGWISYGGNGFIDFGISGAFYADYDNLLDVYNCIRDKDKIPRSDEGYMLCFNVNPCIVKY